MHEVLKAVNHRPYPLPNKRWLMTQTWEDLVFIHYPIQKERIEQHIPSPLEVDTFDGVAWIGVVPFWMKNIRMHGLPPIPFASSFLELNVRTYVTYQNKKGVYFFSLDANHLPAVMMARTFFSLPYLHAHIRFSRFGDSMDFKSVRKHQGFPNTCFEASYKPTSSSFIAKKGSLEEWLVERYNLLLVKKNQVYIGHIHHQPWELQHADIEIKTNDLLPFLPSSIQNEKPLVHYSKYLRAFAWRLKPFH